MNTSDYNWPRAEIFNIIQGRVKEIIKIGDLVMETPHNITGHFKTLTPEEWLEGCASFITDARECISRAKSGVFGREYWLKLADHRIENAEECIRRYLDFLTI